MTGILQDYWQAYLWSDGPHFSGLAMTLWLLILSVVIGFVLAVPLSVARVSRNPLIRLPVWFYTYVFRGTPLYIQLLFFYTGVYSLHVVRTQDFLNAFFRDGFNCTVLAFGLNTCAYMTEIFAGAIRATPHGEVEAARAYGMSRFTLYRRIILPSALRRALPFFSNEVILMLHSTSVAFTATVPDLLKIARDVNSATYASFERLRHRRGVVRRAARSFSSGCFVAANSIGWPTSNPARTDPYWICRMYKLIVEDLYKNYGSHEVLKGVSLKARAGDVISIIGSSGSGKSTFLRCINHLEQPSAGRIMVNAEELRTRKNSRG